MKYIITDGTCYVAIHTHSAAYKTTDKTKAYRFSKREKADNYLNNNLSSWGDLESFYVKLDDDTILTKFTGTVDHLYQKVYPDNTDIADMVKQVRDCVGDVLEQLALYKHQLKEANLEIEDILHAAEFYTLNASQGYKLYRLLKAARIQRRKAKDGVEIIETIMGENIGEQMLNNVASKMSGHVDRSYRPRVLGELFGYNDANNNESVVS